MRCEEAESLLGRLVFDDLADLGEETTKDLRGHVEACEKCRAVAGDMRVAAKLLADGVNAPPAPRLSTERRRRLARLVAGTVRRKGLARVLAGAKKILFKRSGAYGAAAALILTTLLGAAFLLPALSAAREKCSLSNTYSESIVPMDLVEGEDGAEQGQAACLPVGMASGDEGGKEQARRQGQWLKTAANYPAEPAASPRPATVAGVVREAQDTNTLAFAVPSGGARASLEGKRGIGLREEGERTRLREAAAQVPDGPSPRPLGSNGDKERVANATDAIMDRTKDVKAPAADVDGPALEFERFRAVERALFLSATQQRTQSKFELQPAAEPGAASEEDVVIVDNRELREKEKAQAMPSPTTSPPPMAKPAMPTSRQGEPEAVSPGIVWHSGGAIVTDLQSSGNTRRLPSVEGGGRDGWSGSVEEGRKAEAAAGAVDARDLADDRTDWKKKVVPEAAAAHAEALEHLRELQYWKKKVVPEAAAAPYPGRIPYPARTEGPSPAATGSAPSPRELAARRMQDNAIENAVEHPVFVHEGVEVRDHMETENSMANNTARGQEYAISDIPLSGTGVVGNLGVGGGGTGTYGFREGGGRRRAALKGGGSRKSEDMVDNALQWLARNQQPDGSWSVRRWGGSKGDDADVGLTGAALLTFLGAGQTEKTGKYKEVVGKAVDYLISQQAADGAIGFNTGSPEAGSGYNHAMAGLALAEAYGMACQQRTGAAAQKAVDYSVNNFQRPYSGWGYAPRQEPNTSVTGWFMMQLKSAKVAGLRVDGKGFQGAIAWLDKVQNLADAPTNPGKARFRPGMEPTPAMTAIAMVGRQFLGWKQSDPLLIGAADYLAQNLPRWDSPDLQYWYHGTLGMFQMGGDWWKQWNAALRDMLVEKQLRSDDPGMAGSWTVDDEWGRAGGRAFATALGALCLEVYYRYLPIYNGAKTPAPAPAVPAAAAPTQFVKLTEAEARELDARALSLAGLAKAAAPAAAVEAPPEVKVEPAPIEQADIARMPEDDLPPPPVNPFVMTAKDRFSTFAMDVDTASYSMARSYIRRGALPPARTVRMEEFVNAFDYNYPRRGMGVFNIFAEGMPAPFGQGLHLLKIGVQARVIGREGRKPAHLVFVVDTSGSMDKPERLGLAREALGMLLGELAPADTISVVIYGTRADIVMESVPASRRDEIAAALDSLRCGGSTNVAEGVRLGYALARRAFRAGGINRVVLCSDGVANVGAERAEEMLATVKESRECGITFTAAGFGTGAYNDELMEKLADSGDGNYVFIDSREEARRVFVEQMTATLQTVAKDAKIQVEFDPARVRRYRLIGYENRDIADKDFRNDAVDAGEVGSGQSVTALYEVELAEPAGAARSGGIGTVYVRYRNVETNKVEEISSTIAREDVSDRRPEAAEAPRMYLAAGVAEFAEILRRSEHAAGAKLAPVEHMLTGVSAALPLDGRIRELVQLVGAAKSLAGER